GADAVLHVLREPAQVKVARHRLGPRVGDCNKRFLQVLVGEADRLEVGARGGAIRTVDEPAAFGAEVSFHPADLTDSVKPLQGTPAVTLAERSSMITPRWTSPPYRAPRRSRSSCSISRTASPARSRRKTAKHASARIGSPPTAADTRVR